MSVKHHCFTAKAPGRANQLTSKAHVAPAIVSQNPGKIDAREYVAIWDTGATATMITKKVADECGLKPISLTQVHTAGGTRNANVYLVSVGLPNRVMIPNVRVTEGILIGESDILIGMDIISQGDFAVTNYMGLTAFSFRLPSAELIDFVKQKPPVPMPAVAKKKIGQNERCPCGSGKKYKKCCGKNA